MAGLTGNDMPTPGKFYAIHKYEIGQYHAYADVLTVYNKFQAASGDLYFTHWETRPLQVFECVETRGWLGFICRASPAGKRGAYLGYNSSDKLTCKAQHQQEWEDMKFNPIASGGFEWIMRKGERMVYVGYIGGNGLGILRDFTIPWGFTEVKGPVYG
ncbi:hypothetical protein [Photorhabdus sp. CRCIA-P01]|uniref:hypothetical protein n=1 Tax=Photorhabdus sp. CRCIA-P01 TaxID=2019570 RepID=UPI001E526AA3|nr:hypothetical protein [Photorhabdus sp. CRCIA-P01]